MSRKIRIVKMLKLEKKDRRWLKVINGESDRKALYKLLLSRAKKLRRSKLLKSTHFEAVADANHYCHFNGIIVVCIENAVS